ncbi:MAG: hypothetical protein ACRDKT_02380 [Actinomycetota bacterium]
MNTAATGLVELAQKPSLAEFFRDPSLTVACVLLIVVSVGWVLVTRLIVHQMKRAAKRGLNTPTLDSMRGPRDIWQIPP